MSNLEVISPQDQLVIDEAFSRLERSFDEPLHSVAAAARLQNGEIISAMNFKHYAHVVCAEMAALAIAQNNHNSPIELIASVRYINDVPELINACGRCRQVLADSNPTTKFIVVDGGEPGVATVSQVLPFTYTHYPGGKK